MATVAAVIDRRLEGHLVAGRPSRQTGDVILGPRHT